MIFKKNEKLIAISIVFVILIGTLFILSGCTSNHDNKKANINSNLEH